MLDLNNPEKADVILLDNPSEVPKNMVSHFGKACRWICINAPKPFASSRFEEVQIDNMEYIDDVAFSPSKKFNLENVVLFYSSEQSEEEYEYDIATGPYKDVENYIGYSTAAEAIEMALSAKGFVTNSTTMENIFKHFSGEITLESYKTLAERLELC